MKKVIFGLLTLTALGVVSHPAIADEVNDQLMQSTVTQVGEGNRAEVSGRQSINTNHRTTNDVDASYGNVQTGIHDVYQEGVNHRARVQTNQEVRTQTRYERTAPAQ